MIKPLSCVAVCLLFVAVGIAQEPDLTGIKCIVNGKKSAKATASAEYLEGKVFMCCNNCVAAFKEDQKLKDKAKFATKANHQLVLTGQYVQKGCPFSGNAVDGTHVAKVGGADVAMCCEHCLAKVNGKKELADKAELVFSTAASKKGFEPKLNPINVADVKCMMMPKRGVKLEKASEYKEGKVFFCCGRCVGRFDANPNEFATQANHQLVRTGQYVQTACPISGGDVDDEQASVVGGVNVKFCCSRCKGKVDKATDEQAKAELVFSEKRFDKAFSKK